ncbi:Uncharacterised protein [uncultured Clostridium sp.]|nr:Uncharacterised protein [uncultured Clostridium sp.]
MLKKFVEKFINFMKNASPLGALAILLSPLLVVFFIMFAAKHATELLALLTVTLLIIAEPLCDYLQNKVTVAAKGRCGNCPGCATYYRADRRIVFSTLRICCDTLGLKRPETEEEIEVCSLLPDNFPCPTASFQVMKNPSIKREVSTESMRRLLQRIITEQFKMHYTSAYAGSSISGLYIIDMQTDEFSVSFSIAHICPGTLEFLRAYDQEQKQKTCIPAYEG